MKLVVIAVAQSSQQNFSFGIKNSVWGFTESYDVASDLVAGTPVILGVNYQNQDGKGSPRIPFDRYRDGTVRTVVLARASGRVEKVPNVQLWPDEIAENTVKYPSRFPMTTFATVTDLKFDEFKVELAKAFHLSINGQGKPVAIDVDQATLDQIAGLGGLPKWPLEQNDDLGNEEVDADAILGKNNQSSGAGRSSDAVLNKAIENRAVELAKRHYIEEGWNVEEKGKPYDLLCIRDGKELRVEVKGTTTLGGTVELTINEVNSARENASELFVVRNIQITRENNIPIASGGEQRVFRDWCPINIRPTKFIYEVPWDTEIDMDPTGPELATQAI